MEPHRDSCGEKPALRPLACPLLQSAGLCCDPCWSQGFQRTRPALLLHWQLQLWAPCCLLPSVLPWVLQGFLHSVPAVTNPHLFSGVLGVSKTCGKHGLWIHAELIPYLCASLWSPLCTEAGEMQDAEGGVLGVEPVIAWAEVQPGCAQPNVAGPRWQHAQRVQGSP